MSPRDFMKCVDEGGRVRTMKVGKGIRRICYDKDNKAHMGEMMPAKKTEKK